MAGPPCTAAGCRGNGVSALVVVVWLRKHCMTRQSVGDPSAASIGGMAALLEWLRGVRRRLVGVPSGRHPSVRFSMAAEVVPQLETEVPHSTTPVCRNPMIRTAGRAAAALLAAPRPGWSSPLQ